MKKCPLIILIIILCLTIQIAVSAKEVAVNIKPAQKITTSNLNLKEGDCLNFVVIDDVFVNSKLYLKKDQAVYADITSIEDNGFLVQPAKLYIENFRTTDINNQPVKLNGIVYKTGNDHHLLTDFFVFDCLRGGEVHINPEKNKFTVYTEANL